MGGAGRRARRARTAGAAPGRCCTSTARGELKSRFLITAVQRNRNPQLRLRALQEIAALRDPEAFDTAIDIIGGWPRDERREAPRSCCARWSSGASAAATRPTPGSGAWPSTRATCTRSTPCSAGRRPSGCSGLLVNSAGGAHARNARRLVHAARKQDRRLAAALLAAALAHTPEAEEALRGARTRMARKPAALARELLRNFPKGRRGRGRRRKKGYGPDAEGNGEVAGRSTAVQCEELVQESDGASGEDGSARGGGVGQEEIVVDGDPTDGPGAEEVPPGAQDASSGGAHGRLR